MKWLFTIIFVCFIHHAAILQSSTSAAEFYQKLPTCAINIKVTAGADGTAGRAVWLITWDIPCN